MTKSDSLEIPPGLKQLYDAAGPILRYRILCDLQDYDDSWIRVSELSRKVDKHDSTQKLLNAQAANGTWNGMLIGLSALEFSQSTAFALLRLCEFGRAQHPAVLQTIEKSLLATLAKPELLWELTAAANSVELKTIARRLVRDTALRVVTRGSRATNDLLRAQLELILTEWEQFSECDDDLLWPTVSGYAAVCSYLWDEEEFPRVREQVVKLFAKLEARMLEPVAYPDWFDWQRLKVYPKEIYLKSPARLLFQLELSARLGVTRDLPVAQWQLDELEIRQDADGLVRFEDDGELHPDLSWYFPLEAKHTEDYPLEYTFRAFLIYKLLGYDF